MIGCRHKHTTVPRKDRIGEYVSCLDCAARIPWAWQDAIELAAPKLTQPVAERDRLRVERHDEPQLSGLEREAMREEIDRLAAGVSHERHEQG